MSNFQPGLSWSKEPSMPTPRATVAGVIMDEKIYLIGGWNVADIHLGMHLKTDNVEVYDIKNKTWSSVSLITTKIGSRGSSSV
jgi:Kelch motif